MADDTLASYDRVEIIALAIGLAMRDLYITQFLDEYSGIPQHVISLPLEFREYEQLSYNIKTLIDGYDNLYVYSLLPCFPVAYLNTLSGLLQLTRPTLKSRKHQVLSLKPQLQTY